MSTQRQTGFASVAIIPGNSNNVQAIYLGNDDGLPYLIWQSYSSGAWTAPVTPMTNSRPKGFSSLAVCKGYQGGVYVVLLDRLTRQPYLLRQDTSGNWYDQGFLVPETQHEYGYSKVVMVPGNSGNLQVLLLGADDGNPYLIWQNNSNGNWQNGTLPANSSYHFSTMAAAQDNVGNIQSVFLDSGGTPRLLWQNPNGVWTWYNAFPATSLTNGYKDVTIHLGNNDNLQVVMLSTNTGAPYLTWLDDDASAWHVSGALTNDSGNSYFAITSAYARTGGSNYLCVLMLAESNNQVYQLYQDPIFGNWNSYDNPVVSANSHSAGFSAFAACSGGHDASLLLALIGSDNKMPYLLHEDDPLGIQSWYWDGMLPLPQPFAASVNLTPPLSVNALLQANGITVPSTPGNVGICMSGGGSRAMCAGMGQLRALATLQTNNGKSLLSQAKAISTVSGGSWLGMTYSYLGNSSVSDEAFLGSYQTPSSLTSAIVNGDLDQDLIGARSTHKFSLVELAAQAAHLLLYQSTAPSMVWQVLIGQHILRYYGLYKGGAYGYPTSSFSYNASTLSTLTADNAGLIGETFHLVNSGNTSRSQRPFPICNMSMKIMMGGKEYAAPAQSNPLYTGIFSKPGGTDANGRLVGGGGVSSFAFNSDFKSESGNTAMIQQPRQWSLTDAVGVSSAALAAGIWEYISGFASDKEKLRSALNSTVDMIPPEQEHLLTTNLAGQKEFTDEAVEQAQVKLKAMSFPDVEPIPEYYYWSPAYPGQNPNPTRFADAGFLENTGVGGMLAYTDIDTLLVFVNSDSPMALSPTNKGVYSNGAYIANTNIMVEDQIPPLFGYQPYDETNGYVTYADAHNTGYQSVCQVFPSEDFAPFLQGIWAASGSGTQLNPASFLQELTTVQNNWFMVNSGRSVKVMWTYLNPVQAWYNALAPDVQSIVDGISSFPNYSTFYTNLTNQEVTLIANQTAWCLVGTGVSTQLIALFE